MYKTSIQILPVLVLMVAMVTNCQTVPPTIEKPCPMETENGTRIVQTLPNGLSLIEDPVTDTNGLSVQTTLSSNITKACITSVNVYITTTRGFTTGSCDPVTVGLMFKNGAMLVSRPMRPPPSKEAKCWEIPLPEGTTLDILRWTKLVITKIGSNGWTIGDVIATATDKNGLRYLISKKLAIDQNL